MGDQEIQPASKLEAPPQRGEPTREGLYFTPAVDIYETEKELVLLADMPGIDPDDVDIDVKEDRLSIIGRLSWAENEDGTALLAEYRTGDYFRTFTLTDLVDRGGINASLKDGVLTIILPKAPRAVPRKIPITGV